MLLQPRSDAGVHLLHLCKICCNCIYWKLNCQLCVIVIGCMKLQEDKLSETVIIVLNYP